MSYVLFREDSRKREVYLTRSGSGFTSVDRATESNLQFDTAAEAYEFGGEFPVLENWRVGQR